MSVNIEKIKRLYLGMNSKDKRAVSLGLALSAVIMVYCLVLGPFIDHRGNIQHRIKSIQSQLSDGGFDTSGAGMAKVRGLFNIVPVVEQGGSEEEVRKIVVERLYDQLAVSGIKITVSPSFLGKAKMDKNLKKKVVKLHFSGTCSYEQLLKFLSRVYENPLILSVEEIKIKCDPKKRNMVDVNMAISSMVK